LGIDEKDLIDNEEKLEEFIVVRAINDTNLPKLHNSDIQIFKGIADDMFPDSIPSSIKYGPLKNLVEEVMDDQNY
jgi:hypothetical protein